jgi:predicted O-methyltransferase YrrM
VFILAINDATNTDPIKVPADLDAVLDRAWAATSKTPGHLGEEEARLLGMLAACIPAVGSIVEIGSFKGRSTVMLATVAAHYGLPPVVTPAVIAPAVVAPAVIAIDPHNSPILLDRDANQHASSYDEFIQSIQVAGVTDHVEIHRAYSADVAAKWPARPAARQPIRLLWIDGDHSYPGAKLDLDSFLPYLQPFGVVAFHDALNTFPGPIRVFVEDVLRSNQFGAAGFVHSIAWAQYCPTDGHRFASQRAALDRVAAPLLPLVENVEDGEKLHGLKKLSYKLKRSRVPRSALTAGQWAALVQNVPS